MRLFDDCYAIAGWKKRNKESKDSPEIEDLDGWKKRNKESKDCPEIEGLNGWKKPNKESKDCPEIEEQGGHSSTIEEKLEIHKVDASLDTLSDMLLQEVLDDKLDKINPETYQKLLTSMELLKTSTEVQSIAEVMKTSVEDEEDKPNSKECDRQGGLSHSCNSGTPVIMRSTNNIPEVTNNYEKSVSPSRQNAINKSNRIRPKPQVANRYEKSVSPKRQNAILELNRIRAMISVVTKIKENNRGKDEDRKRSELPSKYWKEGLTRAGSSPLDDNDKSTIERLEAELESTKSENSKLEETNIRLLAMLDDQKRELAVLI